MFFALRLIPALIIACEATAALGGSCEDVYQDSTRNRSFFESNWSSLNTVYDQMCSSTGEKKKLSWDSSLGIVVDGLPINMTGNAKSSSEKAENFCRNYHALRFDASHRVVQKDEVVVGALDSYNACKAIEARTGVLVTHKFADPDSLVVNFDFKNSNTVLRIDGVLATNMTCRSNEAPRGREALDRRTNFEMRSNFAIACSRKPAPAAEGASYVPASLAIGTNIESYTLSVTADTLYNNSLASVATAKIKGLQESLDSELKKNADLMALSDRVGKLNVKATKVNIGQFNPGGGLFGGCGTSIDTVVTQFCGNAPRTFKKQTGNRGGDQCGYDEWIIACAEY